MIYSNKIYIPVLSPIQFAEPREQYFYRKQGYVGKILSDTYFHVFIDSTLYESTDDVIIKVIDSRTQYVLSTLTGIKKTLSTTHYYAEFTLPVGVNTQYIYLEIWSGTEFLADSITYHLNPVNTNLKTITYTHSENDFNTVFLNGTPVIPFQITVECGFIPNDFQSKTQIEDYEQQDMINDVIDARPYAIEPITFGDSKGIPNWLAHKLNCIFLLDDIKVDNEPITRANGAEMELAERTYNGMGVWKLNVQTTSYYIPRYRIFTDKFDNIFN